jgi:hypothetical protein
MSLVTPALGAYGQDCIPVTWFPLLSQPLYPSFFHSISGPCALTGAMPTTPGLCIFRAYSQMPFLQHRLGPLPQVSAESHSTQVAIPGHPTKEHSVTFFSCPFSIPSRWVMGSSPPTDTGKHSCVLYILDDSMQVHHSGWQSEGKAKIQGTAKAKAHSATMHGRVCHDSPSQLLFGVRASASSSVYGS